MMYMEHCSPLMPSDSPRYIMGIGAPEDLVQAVFSGYDMFDCVIAYQKCQKRHSFHQPRGD